MVKEALNNYKIKIEVTSQKEGLCKTGVPFPKGKVNLLSQIKLRQNGNNVGGFARPLCYWHDGSIKWISLGFFHTNSDSNQYDLIVDFAPHLPAEEYAPSKPGVGLQLISDKEKLTVSTAEAKFVLDFGTLSLSAESSCGQLFKVPSLGGILSRSDKQQVTAKFKQWDSRTSQNLSTGLIDAVELEIDGYFEYQTDKQPLQFVTLIEFYCSVPFIKIKTTLHNPNPAKHSGGVWDLGDGGSELFDSFVFNLALAEKNKVQFQVSPSSEWQLSEPNTRIIQRASGGKNWQSPVHVDKNNQVILEANGFEVLVDQSVVDSGERATPILHSMNGIGLTVDRFWQNFPAAIGINDGNIEVELFPLIANSPYELQGGEKKTHTFWLSLSSQTDNLNWVHSAAIAKPSNEWITRCAVLPTFLPITINEADPFTKLIKVGLDHTQGFFAKREMIDEYGWRNFGELYADHETAGYQGTELFVSHYNNQYDPIYGFIRQFLLTGDDRWFELADDLAKHVKDIDIYHTEGDKLEYNAGLFWHTDHYLKACTATHRSFSKLQESGAYEDHAGGGGPGGQHCYTTGLTYHYLLTGSEDSKRAVLALGKWITYVYEGSNTCLELLLAIKNRNRIDLKNHFSGQYPFDRGTANYVIALLDCYQLTKEEEYLLRVEEIIQNTVHPEDDINDRNLQDVEERWFYTVFLQAICRYLQTKEEIGSFDDAFYYARDALLHYADWMLSHEYPYLDKPGILEFPNDAWVAQEPRKTHILAAAFYYSPDYKQEYLDKAKFFHEYVGTRLLTSPEASYTRTLVLLMQNQGPLQYYALQQKTGNFAKRRESWPKADYKESSNITVGLVKTFSKRLLNLSIAGEINWLKTRFLK